MAITIEDIKKIIAKFPHSETRVPYTYHHDYLRQYAKSCTGMGRSEVAALKNWSELELYATALILLATDFPLIAVLDFISEEDIEKLQEARDIVKSYINRIDSII